MSIGTELRRRRTEMGLTLRELAKASDLTSGFLIGVFCKGFPFSLSGRFFPFQLFCFLG